MSMISVTRFGEISPLWQNYKVLSAVLRVHLVFGKLLKLLLLKCFTIGHAFIVVDGQRLNNNIADWSH